ncbi:Golgi-associated plant pathogenesis-related protein 1 [Exaiptasia diaphana]|uniref:SCP domain-containing protein n=1 Tax=Exaiptasia diaphana TaxID=2652724 RepID=A0A913YQU1_EXADI|nr:Golgi-associated plant pathogenesis-related protein 1 [Exaiptasia diaphana]
MIKVFLVALFVGIVASAIDQNVAPDQDVPGLEKRQGAHPVSVNVRECLRAHNAYRARHGAPPLEWDSAMAHEAQAYAVTLARTKSMRHSSIRSYGENLAMRQAWGSDVKYTCAQATKDWYDEVKYYSYSRPGFSGKTGHFTQVCTCDVDLNEIH